VCEREHVLYFEKEMLFSIRIIRTDILQICELFVQYNIVQYNMTIVTNIFQCKWQIA